MSKNSLVPSPHIKAKKEQVAKFVIMPGDPLRAKYIAENYLQDIVLINNVRNMLMYTGTYKDKKITIAASGMGCPSIGIYSYELFKFYDVACVLRIGSAGSYQKDVKIYDIINVASAYSESTFAKIAANIDEEIINSSENIITIIEKVAKSLDERTENLADKINLKTGLIHSSDVFYRANPNEWKTNPKIKKCLAVEMEAFALFANAKILKKNSGCLLTISDSFISKESIAAELRETNFKKMMTLALETAISYYQERNI